MTWTCGDLNIYIYIIDIFYWSFFPKSKISILSQTNNLSSNSHLCWVEWSKDINQIFDILPIMGTLEPGHTQESVICRCLVGSMLAEAYWSWFNIIPIFHQLMHVSKRNAFPIYCGSFKTLRKNVGFMVTCCVRCWDWRRSPSRTMACETKSLTSQQSVKLKEVQSSSDSPVENHLVESFFFKHFFLSVFELKWLFLSTKMFL